MRRLRNMGKLVAVPLALGAAVVAACTVFACTLLPSVNLNQAYGVAGADISITGTAWTVPAPVTLHWDSLTGPVLATVMPEPGTSLIGPVTVRVPAGAQPGYHVIIATDNTYSTSTARVPFQVLGTGTSAAGAPQAVLATGGGNTAPLGIGVPIFAMLAAAALGGLAMSGVGVTSLVRTVRARRRVTVEAGVGAPRQR